MTGKEFMEGHPIPQDVTSFQFKIIGNMTIKQFAYLATGSILAYLFFGLPIFVLFKLILAAFFFLLGLALAFVPIAGRPIDTMIFYFIRALFLPNQYVYQKSDKVSPVNNLPQTLKNKPALPATPLSQQPQDKETLEKEKKLLEKEIEEAKTVEVKEQQDPKKHEEAHKKTLLLEEQLKTVLFEKQELEKQLVELTHKFEAQQKPKRKPPIASPPNNPPAQPSSMSDFPPNLINGIVKDPRGNILPNILIEVKDKEGNPVRAFKTNNLGQFAAATSLANGVYTLTFEDPNNIHKFTTVEVIAQGEPINPMTIVSTDPRENLRKDLFGV